MSEKKSEIMALAKILKDENRLKEIGSKVVKDAIKRIYESSLVSGESWTKVWPEYSKKITETRDRIQEKTDEQVDQLVKEVQFSDEELKVLKSLKIID